MTCRMETRNESGTFVLLFQGLLDGAALSEIRVHCTAPVLRRIPARLVLRTGTDVEASCMGELLGLEGVEVTAEAPFLRRWLARHRATRKGARSR